MLRINLLPPYIYDKKKKVQVAALWFGVVAAVAASMVFLWIARSAQLSAANDELTEATKQQTEYNRLEKSITDVKGKIKSTEDKQTFVANAQTWNSAWPSAFEMIRDVRVEDILYKSINFDSAERKTCTIAGFAQDEVRIARWWMLLRNDKDKFDSVFMTIPTKGYDPGGGTATGGMGGMGGMGGGPTGFPGFGGSGRPGGGMGAGGMKPMPGAAQMGGMGGGSSRPAPGMVGMASMGMGGAAGMSRGGFGGGVGGAAAGNSGPGEVEGRRGLNFTATAVLKRPIAGDLTVPIWPLGGGTGTAAGGMGGMGGYSGAGMMGGRAGRSTTGAAGAMPSAAGPPAVTPPADSAPTGRRSKKDTGDE